MSDPQLHVEVDVDPVSPAEIASAPEHETWRVTCEPDLNLT
jgi:hypothetical protein